jgi:hypothetical protein
MQNRSTSSAAVAAPTELGVAGSSRRQPYSSAAGEAVVTQPQPQGEGPLVAQHEAAVRHHRGPPAGVGLVDQGEQVLIVHSLGGAVVVPARQGDESGHKCHHHRRRVRIEESDVTRLQKAVDQDKRGASELTGSREERAN